MSKHNKNYRENELKIRRIETTPDRLTGRAGLSLFAAYMHGIQIFGWFDHWFGSIRKSRKGLAITELFKQALCFFIDGTRRRLTCFDPLSKDEGYAGSIETPIENMASSDRMKRFFKVFAWTRVFLFRRLLRRLFIWRLEIEQPDVIELGIATMVMDNDDSKCRHGVKPTYNLHFACVTQLSTLTIARYQPDKRRKAPPINSMERTEPPSNRVAIGAH